jgi:hypothetical protein
MPTRCRTEIRGRPWAEPCQTELSHQRAREADLADVVHRIRERVMAMVNGCGYVRHTARRMCRRASSNS